MKKITLLIASFLFVINSFSQASGYSFAESAETYTAVIGTNSTAAGDDGIQSGIPIGFTFKFEGLDYTHICISTNGWIKLGSATTTGVTGAANYGNDFSATALNRPLIAAFWDDNHRSTGSIQYVVSGVSPNRILEVGWDGIDIGGRGSTSATASASFKIRISETSNIIQIIYGSVMDGAGPITGSVGLNGNTSFLSITPGSPSTASSTAADNAIPETVGLIGKKFTFTPPPPAAVVPVCATDVVAVPDTACGNFATAITWTAVVNAVGYKITIGTTVNGTDILNNVNLGNVSTYSFIGNLATTYYYKIIPFNAAGDAVGCVGQQFTAASSGCYCSSVPTSNDAAGISNVQFGTTDFPTTDVTYFDHTATPVAIQQSTNANVQITFATGYTYDTNIWVDFNNNFNFEASELVKSIIATVATNPNTMDASFIMPLTAPLGNYRMRIGTADSGQVPPNACYSSSYGVTLDFVVSVTTAPACIAPLAPIVSAITATTATIAWNAIVPAPAVGYEYVISTSNTAPTASGIATTGLSVNLTLLAPNTTFYVFVRSNCGSSFSAWSAASTFATNCVSITAFTENFDGITLPELPVCWSKVIRGASSSSASIITAAATVNSAPNVVELSTGFSATTTDDIILVSPILSNVNLGTHRLKFYASGAGTFQVGTLNNNATTAIFTPLQTITSTVTAQEFIVSFATYTGTDAYIGFRQTSGIFVSILLDDIRWQPVPACLEPVALAASLITASSATISWNAVVPAPAVGYEYVLSTSNTIPSGAGTATTATSINLNPLLPASAYYFFVRSNCGSSFSGWSSVGTFTTLCVPEAVPVVQNFDTWLPSTCWTKGQDGTLAGGPVTLLNSPSEGWTADGFANNTSIGAIDVNLYQLSVLNDWIITPTYIIPANGYKLKFDAAATQYNSANTPPTVPWEADDFVQVLVSTTGNTNWIVLDTFNSSNVPSATGSSYVLNLDAYVGQTARFAFRAFEGTVDGGADIEFSVDNFAVTNVLKTESFDLTGFSSYPNPVKGVLNLSYTKDISEVTVLNLLGQEIISKSVNATQTKIDMSNLSNGTYLVKVTVDGLVKTLKVLKQ